VFSNGVAQAPKDQKPKGVTLQRLQIYMQQSYFNPQTIHFA